MNITGAFQSDNEVVWTTSGAFYGTYPPNTPAGCENNSRGGTTYFDASRAWTGETSSNGNHSHSVNVSISAQGGNREHTHPLTATGSTGSFLIVPTHLKFAYFVRVPEVAS